MQNGIGRVYTPSCFACFSKIPLLLSVTTAIFIFSFHPFACPGGRSAHTLFIQKVMVSSETAFVKPRASPQKNAGIAPVPVL